MTTIPVPALGVAQLGYPIDGTSVPSPKDRPKAQHSQSEEKSMTNRTSWPATGAVGSIRMRSLIPYWSDAQLVAGMIFPGVVMGGSEGGVKPGGGAIDVVEVVAGGFVVATGEGRNEPSSAVPASSWSLPGPWRAQLRAAAPGRCRPGQLPRRPGARARRRRPASPLIGVAGRPWSSP